MIFSPDFDCFIFQELFEGCSDVKLHHIEQFLTVFFRHEYKDYQCTVNSTVKAHYVFHSLISSAVHAIAFFIDTLFFVLNICGEYFRIFHVWTVKRLFLDVCRYGCCFLWNWICHHCHCIICLLLMFLSWSTNLRCNVHDYWTCVQEKVFIPLVNIDDPQYFLTWNTYALVNPNFCASSQFTMLKTCFKKNFTWW